MNRPLYRTLGDLILSSEDDKAEVEEETED